jgi:hypothetical protein
VESGKPLSQEQLRSLRDELRAIEPQLREIAPRQPGGELRPGLLPSMGPPAGLEGDDPRAVVQRLHALLAEARQRGIDVSKAEELDEASKAAAGRGDWQENRRLLQEAMRTVQKALGRESTPQRPDAPRPEPRPRPGNPPRGGDL